MEYSKDAATESRQCVLPAAGARHHAVEPAPDVSRYLFHRTWARETLADLRREAREMREQRHRVRKEVARAIDTPLVRPSGAGSSESDSDSDSTTEARPRKAEKCAKSSDRKAKDAGDAKARSKSAADKQPGKKHDKRHNRKHDEKHDKKHDEKHDEKHDKRPAPKCERVYRRPDSESEEGSYSESEDDSHSDCTRDAFDRADEREKRRKLRDESFLDALDGSDFEHVKLSDDEDDYIVVR